MRLESEDLCGAADSARPVPQTCDQRSVPLMDPVEIANRYSASPDIWGKERQISNQFDHADTVFIKGTRCYSTYWIRWNAWGRNRSRSLAINDTCPNSSAAKSPAKPCVCTPSWAASKGVKP